MSKKPVRAAEELLSPKHLSHRAREERLNRIAKLGTYGVLGLVVAIIVFGALYEYVWKPSRTVAMVGEQKITLKEYQSLYRYRALTLWDQVSTLSEQRAYAEGQEDLAFLVATYDQQIASVQQQLQSLPTSVLNELLDYAIARREADARGLVVTDEDVQLEVESLFGYDRNAPTTEPNPITSTEPITVTPTPTEAPMTEAEFVTMSEDYFSSVEQAMDFSKADLYMLVENSLYEQAVRDAITADVPATGPQVYLWRMAFDTEEEAKAALTEVLAGGNFEELAQARQDALEMNVNAEIGWIAQGQMTEALDAAAFALVVGEVSTPVETLNGWELIKVTDFDAERQLDDYVLVSKQNQVADDWFFAQRQGDDVVSNWSSGMIPTL